MKLMTNIDSRRSAQPRYLGVAAVRPLAGLKWRMFVKRISFGQEGSN
jgi:hypothetical protein